MKYKRTNTKITRQNKVNSRINLKEHTYAVKASFVTSFI